jgi:prophage maintenance system killer protein
MLGAPYVQYIYDILVVKLWPGTQPVSASEFRSRQLLESATNRPFQSAGGKDAYPTIQDKAVALFHALNADHAFWNGNKRTAVLALDHFLNAKKFFLAAGNSEMYVLAEKTASHKARGLNQIQSMEEIRVTIGERIVTFDDFLGHSATDPKFVEYHANWIELSELIRISESNKIMD